MWKYQIYVSKKQEIKFTKGNEVLLMELERLADEMMNEGNMSESGIGRVLYFGTETQKSKVINAFPELLESFINRNY